MAEQPATLRAGRVANHGNRDPVPNGGGYVAYRVTPDMWEEPWILRLLAALPISRYCVLDARTRPAPHPRRQRWSRRLESRLPGRVRSARRFWLDRIVPRDHCLFIYNTWALDYHTISELAVLLSRYEHVGVVSIDESGVDSPDFYAQVSFAVRIGFGGPRYAAVRNLLVTPLGVPKHFVRPARLPALRERRFSWSFLGELKNPVRKEMAAQLRSVQGRSFLHAISTWGAEESIRGAAYSKVLADSVFVPSPSANVHCECYRTYEALECDAIPVVDTPYYRDVLGAPFPVVGADWEDAPHLLNTLLGDPESLEALHRECRDWWGSVKAAYPEYVRRLAEGRGAATPVGNVA